MSITITGLKTVDYTTKTGTRFLAKFDVQLDGLLTLPGLSLVHKDVSNYHVLPPELAAGQVRLCKTLRQAICHQALVAYNAFREVQDSPHKPELSAAVALVRELEQRDAA